MEWNVVWTASAKYSLADIKEYLLSKFTQKEFDKLKERINKQIATIQKGNVKHNYIRRTDNYKVVLHKNTSMYYRITGATIYVMAIWDNRKMKGKERYE
jgi:plasmid stabilization system protein ParE